MRPKFIRALTAFLRDRRGNITLVSALMLPALLGVAGLAVEFGSALNQKTQDQKVADAAAFAAATVYNSNNAASLSSVAQQIATLNGLPGSAISSVGIVSSPTGSGNSAVKVVVATTTPLVLSKVVAPSLKTLDISATAYAEIKGGAPACILALKSSGTGVTLSGGTQVTANACAVESNNTVTVPCGTTITTVALYYNSSSTPSQPCNGIAAPSGKTLTMKKAASTDPIAGTSVLTAATSDISNTQNLASPVGPTAVAGTSVAFDWSNQTSKVYPTGCSGVWNSGNSTYTVTCTGNGPFNFGTITMGGGINLNFNTSGSAQAVYNFTSLNLTGAVNFGPGTYNVVQGLKTGGGSTVTFAAGTFNFGTGALCGSNVSLCHSGTTVTFGGPSNFTFAGGITVSGGATLAMGAGSTNTFYIGKSTTGDSFNSGGGAHVTFADATGSTFKMAGNFNNSGGGACTYIAAADKHQINGSFQAAGGITAGAGLYTINGYMALGASGGGDVTCNGQTVGVMAQNVTFVLTAATSGCNSTAFCVGAGYGHVTITAPTSGSYSQIAMVGPVSGTSTAGATISEGASSTTISGAFYFPQGPISLSGAGNLGSGAGNCLTVVGTQVTLTGGSAVATACVTGSGSNNGGQVVLVG